MSMVIVLYNLSPARAIAVEEPVVVVPYTGVKLISIFFTSTAAQKDQIQETTSPVQSGYIVLVWWFLVFGFV